MSGSWRWFRLAVFKALTFAVIAVFMVLVLLVAIAIWQAPDHQGMMPYWLGLVLVRGLAVLLGLSALWVIAYIGKPARY